MSLSSYERPNPLEVLRISSPPGWTNIYQKRHGHVQEVRARLIPIRDVLRTNGARPLVLHDPVHLERRRRDPLEVVPVDPALLAAIFAEPLADDPDTVMVPAQMVGLRVLVEVVQRDHAVHHHPRVFVPVRVMDEAQEGREPERVGRLACSLELIERLDVVCSGSGKVELTGTG